MTTQTQNTAAAQVNWDTVNTTQTIKAGHCGLRSAEQDRAAAAIRAEAKRRGVKVHINKGAGFVLVSIITPAQPLMDAVVDDFLATIGTPGHRITLDEAPATAPVETVDTLKRMLGDSAQALSLTLAQAETLERELAMATARAEYLAVELRCANQRADSLLEQRDAFQGLLADARSRITELAQIACDRARALDAAKSWIAGS